VSVVGAQCSPASCGAAFVDDKCPMCQTVVMDVEADVANNVTDAKILAELEKICDLLSPAEKTKVC
jgi:hypothetical protein